MGTVKYVPNPLFEDEVQQQPIHDKGMRSITKKVANAVRMVSPHKTGYYQRRIKAKGQRVYAMDVFGHLVEWGSRNNPPYSPLRRGVRAAGLKFKSLPKP